MNNLAFNPKEIEVLSLILTNWRYERREADVFNKLDEEERALKAGSRKQFSEKVLDKMRS